QGAGGIGGLICAVDSTSGSSQTYQYCYDGNGNVGQVVNSADGAIVASYAYDPFGKTIKSDGVYAAENTFKFSTKYTDIQTELNYFGKRYYNSKLGRWINRDPLNERGGVNLYGYITNEVFKYVDYNGCFVFPIVIDPTKVDPDHKRKVIESALSFETIVGISIGATYDNIIRNLYDSSEIKLKSGINKLVSTGVLSVEEGAKLYVEERNKLVALFRGRTSPVGKYVANVLKPLDNLPSHEKLLEIKGSNEAILERAKANRTVNKGVSTFSQAGKICMTISISISLYNVISASEGEKVKVATQEVGGFIGSIGGAWALGESFGAGGTAIGGPVVGMASGFIGVVIGGYLGADAGHYYTDKMYDAIVDE
ncbi:MAG: hypothetical protein CSA18_05085, partial [Deltaproteobacteria bacterium]